MKRWISSIAIILFTLSLTGQKDSTYILHYFSTNKEVKASSQWHQDIMGYQSLSQTLDNGVDDIHIHLETTADYDAANPYLHAFTGSSYKWTQHYIDNIEISNPLIPGDAMHHIPLTASSALTIDRYDREIRLTPFENRGRPVTIRGVRGNLGDRVGFTDWFLNTISGHRSAYERQLFDIQQRPYTSYHTSITYTENTDGNAPVLFHAERGSRVHVDQDFLGQNTTYDEVYTRLAAMGQLTSAKKYGWKGLQYIISYNERQNQGAEFQYAEVETQKRVELNSTLYTKRKQNNADETLALHLNLERRAARDIAFSRNIIDQDGEGLAPFSPEGRQQAITLDYTRSQPLSENISYQIKSRNTYLRHQPSTTEWSNAIFLQNHDKPFTSLHVIDWKSATFGSALLDNVAYVHYSATPQLRVRGGIHLMGYLLSGKSSVAPYPSFDLAWERNISQWTLGTRLGFMPNAFDADQVRILSNDYLSGVARYWNSTDGTVSADELGEVAFTTGGTYLTPGENLGASYTLYLDIPFTYTTKKNWSWSLALQYRQFRDTWEIAYDGDAENYGRYIFNPTIQDVQFFQNPGESRYVVQPLSTNRMNASSFLFDQPFYAGGTFRIAHESQKWFFSASMTANMIVGYAGMGNGPLHNNVNAPSETMADPNLRTHEVGRLDTDRSFISRIVTNYKYSEDGSVGIVLKYKDGQSFAYYEQFLIASDAGNQVAFYTPEVKGDNPLTGERGRREDFFTNFEFHIQHRFPVYKGNLTARLTGHNLLDFANETSEYIFGNAEGFTRSPLELQVPRSISLSLQYSW